MANITVQFTEKTDGRSLNPPVTGSNVAAWPKADFVMQPQDGTYPTTVSPVATGTTAADGSVTLTGLTSGDLYYVSVVDYGTMPHWTQPLAAGTGITNRNTYVPSPYVLPTPTYYAPLCRGYVIDNTPMTGGSLVPVPFDGQSDEQGGLVLDIVTNGIEPTVDGYYDVTMHVTFIAIANGGKFTSGDEITLSFYVGSSLRSQTTVAPPTGATTITAEVNDFYIPALYTARASLTTAAGSTADVAGGETLTFIAVRPAAIP